MATLVKGFASGGGSADRKAKMLDAAMEDLQGKLGNSSVSALAVFADDIGIHVVAATDEVEKGGKKK